jgi:hypothetical protein
MTSVDTAAPAIDRGERMALVTLLYGLALFASALLLFSVQPMFTKMVLPKLGGAPSVWSVAMVSFQAFLFAGYVYAHVLSRTLRPAAAAFVHLCFLALVTFSLPLGMTSALGTPPTDNVMPWLVGVFAASIGLPFIALSASAPLLQSWFAGTRHPAAGNPYVLYATSNVGSFTALIAYPFIIEPFLTLRQQAMVWSIGFGLLALLIAVTGVLTTRFSAARASVAAPVSRRPTLRQRVMWVALTAVPAGLCISVTSYITTDIASAPFIWVVPLAIYLLTFVAVFRSSPWIPHAAVLRYLPYIVAPLAVSILGGTKIYWLASMLLNLVVFAGMAIACHGEAYRQRPANDRLTEFYLWTSLGGVVGGIFAGLLAPHLFKNIYEYPLLICIGLALLPGMFSGGVLAALRQAWIPLALAASALVARFGFDLTPPYDAEQWLRLVLIAIAAAALFQTKHRARYLALIVLAFVVSGIWRAGMMTVETARSFFGIHQVVETDDGTVRLLYHGLTLHGAERVRNSDGTPLSGRPELLSYYYPGGPFADAVEAARATQGRLNDVAVVGLGTGTLACHSKPNEQWTFFEIDPEVIRIARNPERFRFLSECAPNAQMVVGDARLTLSATPKRFNLIVIDAFSSDAIPAHLLTREAVAGYIAHLRPHGVLAMHVSNQHLELASVVAAIARDESLVAYTKQGHDENHFLTDFRANAELVVLARQRGDLGNLPERAGWQPAEPNGTVAWTDDYSNLLQAMLRKMALRSAE